MSPTFVLSHVQPFQVENKEWYKLSEKENLRQYLNHLIMPKLGHVTDDEKLDALLVKNKNVLVSACAGAGKSELILLKLFLLLENERLCPNEIIVLTFNRSVVKLLEERMKRQFCIKQYNGLMTFHALASKIIQYRKPLLYDKKDGRKALFHYTQRIVKEYFHEIGFCYQYRQLLRLTKLTNQFISRFKKTQKSLEFMEREIEKIESKKIKAFSKLGLILFQKYKQKLLNDNLQDFDQMIINSIEYINQSRGDCTIRRIGEIKALKYLLIDEFQDISPLFFSLILAIRKYNPNVKIFAVGDARQSINSFAGADPFYFRNFKSIFEDSVVCHLNMNYRSQKRIIQNANSVMPSNVPMHYLQQKNGGLVSFINSTRNIKVIAKECATLIRQDCGNVFVLSRTNRVGGVSLNSLKVLILDELKKDQSNENRNFEAMTVHAAKGSEVNTAIILNTKNSFPLIHPDNDLFELFGVTSEDVIEEERRLFYVASTRAREQLFIMNIC